MIYCRLLCCAGVLLAWTLGAGAQEVAFSGDGGPYLRVGLGPSWMLERDGLDPRSDWASRLELGVRGRTRSDAPWTGGLYGALGYGHGRYADDAHARRAQGAGSAVDSIRGDGWTLGVGVRSWWGRGLGLRPSASLEGGMGWWHWTVRRSPAPEVALDSLCRQGPALAPARCPGSQSDPYARVGFGLGWVPRRFAGDVELGSELAYRHVFDDESGLGSVSLEGYVSFGF